MSDSYKVYASKDYVENKIEEKRVQPDWNQNDPTAADYVKNRTHYSENVTIQFADDVTIEIVDGQLAVGALTMDEIIEGQTYAITWDGTVYNCVAYIAEGPNTPSLGNGELAEVSGGNGEPFFITVYNGATMVFANAGTHTVSITAENIEKVHKIDKKYLPDEKPYVEIGYGSTLDEVEAARFLFRQGAQLRLAGDLVISESGSMDSGQIVFTTSRGNVVFESDGTNYVIGDFLYPPPHRDAIEDGEYVANNEIYLRSSGGKTFRITLDDSGIPSIANWSTYSDRSVCWSGGAFVVTVTGNDSDGYTADKTFAEIKAAHDAGQVVICKHLGNYHHLHLCNETSFVFIATVCDAQMVLTRTFTITETEVKQAIQVTLVDDMINDAIDAIEYPVSSVNGKTGEVILTAADIGATTESYVDNKVAAMVDSAPETLNTLNELAAALGDDPNFATTIANQIGNKVDKTTQVNGKALSSNITLSASDVGALPDTTAIPSIEGLASQSAVVNGEYIVFTSAGTSTAYTGTIEGITELKKGLILIMIPHTTSTSRHSITLNINGLGAKSVYRRATDRSLGYGITNDWIAAGSPIVLLYGGTYWEAVSLPKPLATDLEGSVPISLGGHGGTTAAEARANLGITPENIGALSDTALTEFKDYTDNQISSAIEAIPQADWSQNDPTSKDYIKNRTHWEKIDYLLPQTTITLNPVYGAQCSLAFASNPVNGNTYDIIYNGNSYSVVAKITYGCAFETSDFMIMYMGSMAQIQTFDGSSTATISISGDVDGTYTELLAETTISLQAIGTSTGTITEPFAGEIAADVTYTVNCNGTLYSATLMANPRGSYLGDADYTIYIGIPTDGVLSQFQIHDDVAEATISIYQNNIQQLDVKYLPNINANLVNGSAAGSLRTIGSAEESDDYTIGDNAFAEGKNTTASGNNSHAEGYGTTASGGDAHAEGMSTTASGLASHAEGYRTAAQWDYAHAEGLGTVANGKSQHVAGEYNIINTAPATQHRATYAHIVGNGTSTSARSNAHTLDWNGNAWFAGNVYIGGTGQDDTAATKLITQAEMEAYVNESILGGAW